ncbi:MAG: amidase [Streptosporangiaceae bacterium]|nr:amidase [Streptosporangiaceae bacterium]
MKLRQSLAAGGAAVVFAGLLTFSPQPATAAPIQRTEAASKAKRPSFDVTEATIESIHKAFASHKLTCVDLVQSYIDRINAYDKPADGKLATNAIQTVNSTALTRAAELDAAYAKSSRLTGPLHCIPVLVKDQVETADMPTTYGSAIFKGFQSGRDATIITKLRAAGAVILAKTNMGEFASGYAGSAFGVCRNPYDLTRSPSSSSCGTGAGIAANYGAVGIAEDTGGSVRAPAGANNLVGLRPTTPLISRYGMIPATPTRDTLGPLTRTVKDAAIVTSVIAGYDPNDPLTAYSVGRMPADGKYQDHLSKDALKGKRIGVIRETMASDTDPTTPDYARVRAVVDKAYADLSALGATVIDPIVVPNLKTLMSAATDYRGETEEAINAYLKQLPHAPVSSFAQIANSPLVTPTRRAGLRSALGKTTNDPAYLKEMQAREKLRQTMLKVMADNHLDAIAYPVAYHEPPIIPDDILTNPNATNGVLTGTNRYLSPMIGFPALAVPAGFTSTNLPVGIDLLGRPFTEEMLFQVGYAYEQGTKHRKPPSTTPPLPTP